MSYLSTDKLRRAQQWAKENGKEGDEEAVRDRYLKIGGLMAPSKEASVEEAPSVNTQPETAQQPPKPKKPKKPKA